MSITSHWPFAGHRRAVQGTPITFCRLLVLATLLPWGSFAQPVPLPLHWWSRGAGGGGAFFSPSLSPLDQGTLYISTDMGTVFHSANGGALWDSYAFGNLQGGRLARMQFTSDPAVLYVLDGRVDYVTYLGGAIFKSVNGGSSWFRLTGDPCFTNDATRKKLRADPTRADHLVLGHDRGRGSPGMAGPIGRPSTAPAAAAISRTRSSLALILSPQVTSAFTSPRIAAAASPPAI